MCFFRLSLGRLIALAASVILLLSPRPAAASQELREALRDLAAAVNKVLAGEREDAIAIGSFTGPATLPTASGPGIAQVLGEEFAKLGVAVKERAKFGITGSYAPAELPAANPDDRAIGKKVLAIKLTASLVDGFNNPVGNLNFQRVIRGEATFLELIPLTVSLPPQGREVDRHQRLRDIYTPPKDGQKKADSKLGSVIRSGPYAIEILVEDKPREAVAKEGLAFVPIRRGEAYAVRLINDSEYDAAVQLRIDGLSVFTFSELRHTDGPQKGEPGYTVMLVPAKKSAIIPGWHITNEKTDRFLVTAYAKSASANLKPTAAVGTISATFQAAWEKTPPPDEPGKKKSPGSGDATGRGPRIDKKYEEVTRQLGVIRDEIAVRYTRPERK
jgi:hypothetical protein